MNIATVFSHETLNGDWVLSGPDLAAEDGLRTAILISLFTDARARPDDPIDAAEDPRGWWGDVALDGAAQDETGSRLWLLEREKSTEQTRARAELYIREALAWMIEDGVAAAIDIASEWQGPVKQALAVVIRIRRPGGESQRFDALWQTEGGR